jgi:N-acetylneuraminic acid mutarotase
MQGFISFILALATGCAVARSEARIEVEWSRGPDLPIAVAGHCAAVVDGQVVSTGGSRWIKDEKEYPTSIFAWKVGQEQWRTVGKLPSPMTYSAGAATARELFIVGGSPGDRAIADVVAVDASGSVRRLRPLPSAIDSACAAVLGGLVFVVGGTTDSSDYSKVTDTVLSLDLAKPDATWSVAAQDPLCARAIASAVACGEKIYVFGGYTGVDVGSAFSFSPQGGRITKLPDLPSKRHGCAAAVFNDRYIFLADGCESGNGSRILDELLVFDTVENSYAKSTAVPYAALAAQAIVLKDQLLVFGGEDRPRSRSNQLHVGKIRLVNTAPAQK